MADTEREGNPLESIADGYYEVDLEGRFTHVNPALCRILGHERAEILGRSYRHFTGRGGADPFRDPPAGERFEWELQRPGGERVSVEGSVVPIRDRSGKGVGFRGLLRDVSGPKRRERQLAGRIEQLSRARGGAIESARRTAEFLAGMSQEIRTPMAGIVGMTELALETELTGEQRGYLEAIRSSANALLTVINDILDFSRIEAGLLRLEEIPFGLRDCLADVLEPLRAEARAKGLELRSDVESSTPDDLIGDPTRLRQVLVNLVSNAIKFTTRGHVALRVTHESPGDGETELRFEVTDTGVGIPEKRQRRIFDAFPRFSPSTARKDGGTGLGLAISKRLVDRMRGRIWMRSSSGQGSTFCFTARFAPGPRSPRHELARHEDLKGLLALVVDGHETSRHIVIDALKYFGLRVRGFGNADAAWQGLERASGAGEPYDVAVIDAQLPDGSGFDLAARIRTDEALENTRTILLARSGQRADAARCREIGIAAYLSKPTSPLDLLDALRAVVGESGKPQAPLVTRHSLRVSRPRLSVLVAEDDSVNQLVIRTLLEKAGHRVTVASNGRDALARLETQSFDVVLMDVEMPEMNGVSVTRRLREAETGAEGTRRTPVVALTAHATAGDRERFLEAGMDGYLSKPFEPGALFTVLEQFAQDHPPDVAGTAEERAAPVESIVDRRRLLEQTGGDPDLLRQIVEVFLQERSTLLDGVRLAVERLDAPGIERAAHRLKSTCGTLAARQAAEAAAQLERVGKAGELGQVRQLYQLLESRMRQVEVELVAIARPWTGGRTAST